MSKSKRAAIYCRISEDREGRELGVTRQEEDGHALARRLGLQVVEVYRDNDISASTKSRKVRPEYRRMLDDARAGRFAVIIAYTSGRLTRRPREHEDLIDLATEHGVRYEYVRSPSFDLNTAQGRRVARTLAVQDAGEAEDIAERVTRAKLQSAQAGKYRGSRRPYGYEKDGLTVRESEAAVLRRIADDFLAGHSIRAITGQLNADEHKTSTGGAWRHDAVREVLLRPRNAGLVEHHGEIVGPAQWPAILDASTWMGIRATLLGRSRPKYPRRWLGSGLYLCGLCDDGATMTSSMQSKTARAGAKPAYTCTTSKHLTRDCVELDAYVSAVIVARLSRDDATDLLTRTGGKDTVDMHVRAVELRERLDGLAAVYADGAIDGRQLREGSQRIRASLDATEAEIAEAGRESVLAGLVGVPDVAAVWDGLTLDRRRAVLDALVTVTVLPSGRGRPAGWRKGDSYFRPDTVDIRWRLVSTVDELHT